MDPLHQDKKTRVLADKHAVQYQAYSSLGTQWISTLGRNPVLMHPVLRKIGADVAASIPQVIIAWARHRGAAVIPASRSEKHIAEIFSTPALQLAEEHLIAIDGLDKSLCNGNVWECTAEDKKIK